MVNRSNTITGTFGSAASASAEIDLAGEYRFVTLRINATEAAKLGTAANTSITVRGADGVTFFPVYNEGMTAIQVFAKPASGAVQVTFQNVNGRFIKFATSVVTTAALTFEVVGFEHLEYQEGLTRATFA